MSELECLLVYCAIRNIHPVCFLCRKKCKQPYSFWSFQMPPETFCEDFEEDDEAGEADEA